MFTKKKPLVIKKQTVAVPADKSRSTSNGFSSSPVVRSVTPLPKPRPSPIAARSFSARHTPKSASPSSTSGSTPVSAKRKRQARAAHTPLDFGSSDDSEEELVLNGADSKRRRPQNEKQRKTRDVRSKAAFSEDVEAPQFIHAAEIPRLDRASKYESALLGLDAPYEIELQYPSRYPKERYCLIRASNDSQGYDPVQDIVEVMHQVIENYLPEDQRPVLDDEGSGLPRRLNRAMHKNSIQDIDKVIGEWNDTIMQYLSSGFIREALDKMGRPAPSLVERIVNQTFARTVSLNLKALHEYEAGTDNVYGELLPKFVSRILEDTSLGSDQVFVDLGSGVGNVVLQAALEAGCESWGCEMMEKYCDVADIQHEEFVRRCHLWGIDIGAIHLERGDFLANQQIHAALRRADVVLVNNQVFTPVLNDALTTLFLDLKDGCRIVSLKSFVPAGHKINSRNSQSPYSVLGNIQQKEYFSKSVSWTDQGGKYFISTKDQAFLDKYNQNGL